MTRDEVFYYFRTLQLLFVVMAVIQLVAAGTGVYLLTSLKNALPAQAPAWVLYLSPIGLILGVAAMFLYNRRIKKVQRTWGVEQKMKGYRSATIQTWILLLLGALMVDAIFIFTSEWWILTISGAILIPYFSTYITQIRVIKNLKLTKGEVIELQSFYKNK